MKRSFIKSVLVFSFLVLFLLPGCDNGNNSTIIGGELDSRSVLVNTIYAGPTPDGGWLTMSFGEKTQTGTNPPKEIKVYCAYSTDTNTTKYKLYALHDYTYNEIARSGVISRYMDSEAPGPFTLSEDGKTMIFSSYGESGNPLEFKRVRNSDGIIDDVPFTLGALPADLAGSVWAGEGPREGDWVTAVFTSASRASVSFIFDNSTNVYTITTHTHSGGAACDNNGKPQFASYMGPFIISANDTTMTQPEWHNGTHTWKRYR